MLFYNRQVLSYLNSSFKETWLIKIQTFLFLACSKEPARPFVDRIDLIIERARNKHRLLSLQSNACSNSIVCKFTKVDTLLIRTLSSRQCISGRNYLAPASLLAYYRKSLLKTSQLRISILVTAYMYYLCCFLS